MGFVSDMESKRKGGQAPEVKRDNLPKKTSVLPPDFPTMVTAQPMPDKHVAGATEFTQPPLDQEPIEKEEEGTSIETSSGTKISISIRLDEEIITWFKRTGRGWQSRINAVLLDHVSAG